MNFKIFGVLMFLYKYDGHVSIVYCIPSMLKFFCTFVSTSNRGSSRLDIDFVILVICFLHTNYGNLIVLNTRKSLAKFHSGG